MSSPYRRAVVFTMVLLTAFTGCQPGRPLYRPGAAVASILTHLDTDGFFVSLTFVVSMLSTFIQWQMLIHRRFVDGEMPGEITQQIVARL